MRPSVEATVRPTMATATKAMATPEFTASHLPNMISARSFGEMSLGTLRSQHQQGCTSHSRFVLAVHSGSLGM